MLSGIDGCLDINSGRLEQEGGAAWKTATS